MIGSKEPISIGINSFKQVNTLENKNDITSESRSALNDFVSKSYYIIRYI